MRRESGQALLLLVAALGAILAGALVLGTLARAVGDRGRGQRAADLGALAGAKAMRELYPRLYVPATVDGAPNPQHVDKAAYLAAGRRAATAVARANGARAVAVSFPGPAAIAPVVVRVAISRREHVRIGRAHRTLDLEASADAQLSPVAAPQPARGDDEYAGPLAHRQGEP